LLGKLVPHILKNMGWYYRIMEKTLPLPLMETWWRSWGINIQLLITPFIL
jgi:hypothetical protein